MVEGVSTAADGEASILRDEPDHFEAAKENLLTDGREAEAVSNGNEGLTQLKERNADVAILGVIPEALFQSSDKDKANWLVYIA